MPLTEQYKTDPWPEKPPRPRRCRILSAAVRHGSQGPRPRPLRTLAGLLLGAVALACLVVLLGLAVASADERDGGCESRACVERVKARYLEHRYQLIWRSAPVAVRAHLRRIAACESNGNERAVSPGGKFRGLLQFLQSTWEAMGGRGDPAAASRWEQWARGVRLYIAAGPGQWPVCQFR